MFRWAAVVGSVFVLVAASSAANPKAFPRGDTSFPTSRSGWVPSHGLELPCQIDTVCATEDGGRTWRTIFDFATVNRDPVRTSVNAGVVLAGRWFMFPYWTRDGGKTWFPMERPATPREPGPDPSDPHYQGRGESLFLHYGGRTLFRVVPWPPRTDPSCTPIDPERGEKYCKAPPDNAGLQYRPVYTLENGTLGRMTHLPGGVVAPVTDEVILVHRLGVTTLHRLPALSPGRCGIDGWGRIAASWPSVWHVCYRTHGERRVRRASLLRLSRNGGRSWRVFETTTVQKRPGITLRRADVEAKVPLSGGWLGTVRGRTAIAVHQAGMTRVLTLPRVGRCSPALARPVADWPFLYVESRSGRMRWWSDYGGRTWAVSGRC